MPSGSCRSAECVPRPNSSSGANGSYRKGGKHTIARRKRLDGLYRHIETGCSVCTRALELILVCWTDPSCKTKSSNGQVNQTQIETTIIIIIIGTYECAKAEQMFLTFIFLNILKGIRKKQSKLLRPRKRWLTHKMIV